MTTCQFAFGTDSTADAYCLDNTSTSCNGIDDGCRDDYPEGLSLHDGDCDNDSECNRT